MLSVPLISVLLPVYNCEKYIFEAVESILTQTFINFEILIIDDCSTDTTLQICKSFKDDRIVIIEKEKNSGYTNSLNYGITIAKGKYIARMDGDDISLPTRFEKQVAFMEANEDVVVCGTNFSIIGTNQLAKLPEFNKEIKTRLLYGNCLGHPTVMLRKSVFDDNNIIYDTQMEPAEDFFLWVQLLKFGKLHNLQESLLNYRVHDMQVSFLRNKKQQESSKQSRLSLLNYLGTVISNEQKEVYLKAIDSAEELNLEEFLIFLDLKKMMISSNNDFFINDEFKIYWIFLESKFISYYFKYRSCYKFAVLRDYFFVFNKLENKISTKDLLKLIVKSLVLYKVK